MMSSLLFPLVSLVLVLATMTKRNEAWTGRRLLGRTGRSSRISSPTRPFLVSHHRALQPPQLWLENTVPSDPLTPSNHSDSHAADNAADSDSGNFQDVRIKREASHNFNLSNDVRNQVQVEDVSSECAEYHNSKRVFRLETPLQSLSAGVQQRAYELIQQFANNDCEPVDTLDTCSARGMNLFDSPNDPTCGAALDAWYRQLQNYTYERYSDWHHPDTGHFTQALWNDSQQLGCYRTKGCRALGKQERLLCLYSPSGNVVGRYPFTIKQWQSLIKKEGLEVTTIVGPFYGPGLEKPENTPSTPASTTSTTPRPSYTTTTTRTTATTTSRPVTSTTTRTTTTTTTPTTTSTTTTPSTTTTTTTTTTLRVQDFTDACLDAHNEKRVNGMTVPISALRRHSEAQAQAENFRDQMEKRGCPFQHSGATHFGENLYKASFTPTCADAVSLWYAERTKYTRYTAINTFNYSTFGHFTQVMWADSTGLGCAASTRCKTVVCNYYPPGNYVGRYPFRYGFIWPE